MSDIYDKKERSLIMSHVKSKDTTPEIVIRKFIFSKGIRYRVHDKRYPGKPDLVIPKYDTIIFVHGCFWHGHKNCKSSKLPKTRREFWEKKISDNIIRDKKNIEKLRKDGWNVILVWECELSTQEKRDKRLNNLISEIIN